MFEHILWEQYAKLIKIIFIFWYYLLQKSSKNKKIPKFFTLIKQPVFDFSKKNIIVFLERIKKGIILWIRN
jgi:hypothetical protein